MKTVKIGDYVKTVTPKVKLQAKNFLKVGEYPVVSQEIGLINGYWNHADAVMRFNKPVVVFGDHTRIVKFIDFDFVPGADGTKILLPPKDLDTKYLYFWFLANPIDGLGYARHFRIIKDKEIRIPSPEEQRRVVERLDAAFEKIDRAIALTEKNIKNSWYLFTAFHREKFDSNDITKKLGEVLVLQRGYDLPKSLRTLGKHPLVSSSGIIDSINEYKVRGPGICTGRSGSVGATFYVENNFWPLNTTLYVKDFLGNDPRYCYWLLYGLDLKQFAGGTGVPTLNRNIVHEHMVRISHVESQKEIVDTLDAEYLLCQDLSAKYQNKLSYLKSLKQALLAQAFSQSEVE